MTPKTLLTRTLGLVSAQFINALATQGKELFTLDDALSVYGKSRLETAKFVSTLIKRGIVFRVKAGVFLLLQAGKESSQISNWPVLANELASPEKYYISHYSAMRVHGMTTHPLLEVYVTMLKRRTTKKLHNISYRFIYSKPDHFWGIIPHWATKQDKVQVSDIERTILDALERPDLNGGIIEIVRGIWVKQRQINWKRLKRYALKFHAKSASKRLGYILEMLGLGNECTQSLVKHLHAAKDFILLDSTAPKQGPYVSRWHVRVNINFEELKASIWG